MNEARDSACPYCTDIPKGHLIETTPDQRCIKCGRYVGPGGSKKGRIIDRPHYKVLLEECQATKEMLYERVKQLEKENYELRRRRWWQVWR